MPDLTRAQHKQKIIAALVSLDQGEYPPLVYHKLCGEQHISDFSMLLLLYNKKHETDITTEEVEKLLCLI